ncbi:hypothetical protein CEQ90_07730 [Lewinellaceae bacterium SD302]|nr:hypothetical protein CEQ90_07730 [Lewinellaceae bacterium SD302]
MLFQKTDDKPVLTESQRQIPQLAWVDGFSRLLDTKFRIPGTSVRFGLDFLMGLVPGVGSVASLGFSGLLIITMARHGASGMLAARMIFNVLLDTIVGFVPILGNLFDLFYKANYRNLELMREFYGEGKHRGSAWPVIIGVAVAILLVVVGTIWLMISLLQWIF